jgi:DNA-directed RNA polymerase subunit N (RpoN/RPB10)
MATLSSEMKVPVKCDSCGRTMQKRFSEMNRNAELTCKCGATFRISGDDFQRAGKALDDFQKSIAKLGRTIGRK